MKVLKFKEYPRIQKEETLSEKKKPISWTISKTLFTDIPPFFDVLSANGVQVVFVCYMYFFTR